MPSHHRHVVHVNSGDLKVKPAAMGPVKKFLHAVLVHFGSWARAENETHGDAGTDHRGVHGPSIIVNRQHEPETVLDGKWDNVLKGNHRLDVQREV